MIPCFAILICLVILSTAKYPFCFVILSESEVSTQNTGNGLLNAEFGVDFFAVACVLQPVGSLRSK